MIYYVFLVALAAGALALPPTQPNTEQSTQTEEYVPMKDLCLFRSPTVSCNEKCEKLGQEAYCEQWKCLCRPEQSPQAQEHQEPQQEATVPTNGPAATTTLPGHSSGAAISAKPTEEDIPMKCFLGLRPIVCLKQCEQRGLEAYCEPRMDGDFCVCGAHKDNQPEQNTDTALTHLPSTEDTPLMCFLGRKPLLCVVRCEQRDLESRCNERNICVCSSEHLQTVSVTEESDDGPDDDDEEEGSSNVFMYFIKWTKLFGDDNNTETTAATTTGPQEPPHRIYYMQEQSWNFEYLLILLILGLLCILITMELLTCYKRRKNRNKVGNIFQAMPATHNKS